MSRVWHQTVLWSFVVAWVPVDALAAEAPALNPSPYSNLVRPRRRTLAESSWTYRQGEEPKEARLNDLIVVLVDEKSQVTSEGEMDRRKKADGTFSLKDWIGIHAGTLEPDKQQDGDPAITGEMQGKYRAESELETRDSMRFRIACRVVDIRPNGNVLIEGRRSILNNDDTWEMSLIGVIRPEDVLPNNTVLSENVADLRIVKRETGHVRDGYRRGWFTRCLDMFQPF